MLRAPWGGLGCEVVVDEARFGAGGVWSTVGSAVIERRERMAATSCASERREGRKERKERRKRARGPEGRRSRTLRVVSRPSYIVGPRNLSLHKQDWSGYQGGD